MNAHFCSIRVSRTAFTLIELLVVVAIIAMLIAILLPTLAVVREESRALVCRSNVRQTALAFFIYAEENGTIPGTYWQKDINQDWAGVNNQIYRDDPNRFDHPIQASPLRDYVHEIGEIFECPTAQREANTYFDFTVIIRLAGARTDLTWRMSYPTDPRTVPTRLASRTFFPAIPFLIEEDAEFYNAQVDDGSWANYDQISVRHRGQSNLGFLDGSVTPFESPKGTNPYVEEPTDLRARYFRLWVSDEERYPVWGSGPDEYGWVNDPW